MRPCIWYRPELGRTVASHRLRQDIRRSIRSQFCYGHEHNVSLQKGSFFPVAPLTQAGHSPRQAAQRRKSRSCSRVKIVEHPSGSPTLCVTRLLSRKIGHVGRRGLFCLWPTRQTGAERLSLRCRVVRTPIRVTSMLRFDFQPLLRQAVIAVCCKTGVARSECVACCLHPDRREIKWNMRRLTLNIFTSTGLVCNALRDVNACTLHHS